VAAPIFSSDGVVVAAIGITAAGVRLAEKRIPEVAATVRSAAAEASQLLGYSAQQ
jgi:DNA-binding IclR family transcriptional regulator